MYIVNGIAYAAGQADETYIESAKPLDDMMLLLTFRGGERRIFDASELISMPAFKPLSDEKIFRNIEIDHGVVTWRNREIDVAPEAMYAHSYPYE